MNPVSTPKVWTVTDDRAGNRVQVQALAASLGGVSGHVEARFGPLHRRLAPHWLPGAARQLQTPDAESQIDIVIGCGRQAALALRAWQRERALFTVQILDPRIARSEFDLVIAPEHDGINGNNVLLTTGALNEVNDAWLERMRVERPRVQWRDAPLHLLLLGGPHAQAPLTLPALLNLMPEFAERARHLHGSALVCGSRRTPGAWRAALRQRASTLQLPIWLDAKDGENPYGSALAHAEEIIVTADSVNMLSEACATHASVIPFSTAPPSRKLARFHRHLEQTGRLSTWTRRPTTVHPLRETERMAAMVLQRWQHSRSG